MHRNIEERAVNPLLSPYVHHDQTGMLIQFATYAVSRPRKTTCDDARHDTAHHIVQRT